MSLMRETTLYIGHWPTLLLGSLAVAFGFAGIHVVSIAENPLTWSGGVLVGAIIGFIVHETAHREAARRQGCIAGFVLTKLGLAITLLSGVLRSIGLPFAILAPGYVSIICQAWWTGGLRREDVIAAWGPASNIVLALVAYLAAGIAQPRYTLFLAGFRDINAWLAFFNLLPLDPLDGAKVMRHNTLLWVLLLLTAIIAMTL